MIIVYIQFLSEKKCIDISIKLTYAKILSLYSEM